MVRCLAGGRRGGQGGGRSAVGHGRGDPAVLLVGFHQGLEGGLGFLPVEGFLGLSWFPTYTTLEEGRGETGEEETDEREKSE